MPLPESGQISLNDFHTELGSSGQISLNDEAVRGLLGKSSGAQSSMSEFYGASAGPPVEVIYAVSWNWTSASYYRDDEFGTVSDTTPTLQAGDLILWVRTSNFDISTPSGFTITYSNIGPVWFNPYRYQVKYGYRFVTGSGESLIDENYSNVLVLRGASSSISSLTLLENTGNYANGGGGYNFSEQGSALPTVTRTIGSSPNVGYDAYIVVDMHEYWTMTKARSADVDGDVMVNHSNVPTITSSLPAAGGMEPSYWIKAYADGDSETITFSDGRSKQSDNIAQRGWNNNLVFGVNF